MPVRDPIYPVRPKSAPPLPVTGAHALSRQRLIDRLTAIGHRYGFVREPINLDTAAIVLRKGDICCTIKTNRTFGAGLIRWGLTSNQSEPLRRQWMDQLDRKLYGALGERRIVNLRILPSLVDRQMRELPELPGFVEALV